MIGFSVTIISTLLWPLLPTASFYITSVVVGILVLKRAPIIAGALLAVGWVSIFVQLLLFVEPPNRAQNIIVRGEIISLVRSNSDWVSMDIRLLKTKNDNLLAKVLRVTWQHAPKVTVGDHWEWVIRPKPITSVLNQGGYNQQRSLLSKHIVMKGRVISGSLIGHVDTPRSQIITRLTPLMMQLEHGDLILAVLVGDKSLINELRWSALRVTGTGHLIAISGLHLTVVASWVFILSQVILSRYLVCVSRRNLLIAGLLSALSAGAYAYLAGFALPTQRALIMLLLLLLLAAVKRYSSPWERLLYALFLILLLDPLSSLSASFWLSFSALGIILLTISQQDKQTSELRELGNIKRRHTHKMALFWSIQWRLSLGLGILQAILFGGISAYGLLFNLILVPWFSLIVIPLAMVSFGLWMLAGLFSVDIHPIFYLVDMSLLPMSLGFELVDTLPSAWIRVSSHMIACLGFFLLGVWLLLKGTLVRWRLVSLTLSLPLIFTLLNEQLSLSASEWRLHLLDVGQGLSVVIEKSGHGLIYDTGAAYGSDFTYAERVILPFLHTKGINRIDYLVISHSDNDHAGGAKVILQHFEQTTLISDLPYVFKSREEIHESGTFGLNKHAGDIYRHSLLNCRPKRLDWQGLTLEILAPLQASKGNNGSCVLKVSDGEHQVLLTGDVEHKAEHLLLQQSINLSSEVLIAPHHGSRTSSTQAFINKVSPSLVLIPAGFNNRYGLPKHDVVERYIASGAEVITTGKEGQVSIVFRHDKRLITTYRSDLAPFWYNSLFRFGELKNTE